MGMNFARGNSDERCLNYPQFNSSWNREVFDMTRERFIIVNRASGIYGGMIYDRPFADMRLVDIQKAWPGVEWEIEETPEQFPVPGLIHIGEVRAAKFLKRHISGVQPAE